QAEFDALAVATATYAAYFKYLDTIHGWLTAHGVADAKARTYVTTIFEALAHAPEKAPDASFAQLTHDFATPGGLNEQVERELTAKGLFAEFSDSLDRIHRRIIGS